MNNKNIYCTSMKNFFEYMENITSKKMPHISKLCFEMSLYHELCTK